VEQKIVKVHGALICPNVGTHGKLTWSRDVHASKNMSHTYARPAALTKK